jgi:PilZ domain
MYRHGCDSGFFKGSALMEHRGYDRIGVEYSAAFSGNTYRANGTVLNLSMVGCRCRTGFAVQKGESLGLLIHVPGYEHPLYVALAEVRWSQGEEFGVEFIHMELEDRQRLAQVMRR